MVVLLTVFTSMVMSFFIYRGIRHYLTLVDRNHLSTCVIETATDAIVLADQNMRVVVWNQSAEKLFGYTQKEIVGKPIQLIFAEEDQDILQQNRILRKKVKRVMEGKGMTKWQSEFAMELSISTWKKDGASYFCAIVRDITTRKTTEEQITRYAYLDSLTGLANRRSLEEEMQKWIDNLSSFYVLFLDVNNFKTINDTHGHQVGDNVLNKIGEMLVAVSSKDTFVSRWGGDEFCLLLSETRDIQSEIQRLSHRVGITLRFNEVFLPIHISIGHSHFPSDGLTATSLIEKADNEMYQKKRCTLKQAMEETVASP
ncbi:sensor domain-containing diguanylate cyclase [Guptibacillus hwajinpoensis]|uniref:sensor domain-containing diguanylate cyclase n=1 Tax=Guptibacillus hwajinpoensis TaxID=208199 RepID=UPI001CD519A5|nr:GGDEF domain-containing protein [Pseudalkalibacillus hwajinpoensis]MCA0993463.1 diguanylate cyclase [Pseudalkalibacillus hwajinpoensis]